MSSTASPPASKFKYCVGIDFGSTFSGFAFASLAKPDEVCGFNEWDYQPVSAPYWKTPSSIRYRREADGTYTAAYWGHKSRKAETKALRTGELIEVKKFKLWFDTSIEREGLPPGMHWMQPSIDYLSFMSEQAMDVLQKRFPTATQSEILWCVTVPAIWDDKGKDSVRRAATLAGIVDENSQDHLIIILEPEAAALYTLKHTEHLLRRDRSSFMILDAGGGTVDLTSHIINMNNFNSVAEAPFDESSAPAKTAAAKDALPRGTATDSKPAVDVQQHKEKKGLSGAFGKLGLKKAKSTLASPTNKSSMMVESVEAPKAGGLAGAAPLAADAAEPSANGGSDAFVTPAIVDSEPHARLVEASRGTGGLCGSTYVDLRFLSFFGDQIGTAHIKEMHMKRPDALYSLLEAWEQLKRDYQGPPPPGAPHEVEVLSLPSGVLPFIPDSVKDAWAEDFGADGELHITQQQMYDIFSVPIEQCMKLVEDQLDRTSGKCDYLVLVGGFSASKYLCNRVSERFSKRFKSIVVPINPTSAVVQGAVLYGLDPNIIQKRRLRNSYGYISNAPISRLETYAEEDVWTNPRTGSRLVKVFKCLVAENQEVGKDEGFHADSYMLDSNQSSIEIDIVRTDQRLETGSCYSLSQVDCEVLGQIRATIPGNEPIADPHVRITFVFGQTQIKAVATVVATGQQLETALSLN
ncbi:hypothetical protein BC831DRAFT_515668 [Entophlyctis helioformis]|nr:hypothetical protein BC831DRAFT_515668 [Entophlyctis helioformis]